MNTEEKRDSCASSSNDAGEKMLTLERLAEIRARIDRGFTYWDSDLTGVGSDDSARRLNTKVAVALLDHIAALSATIKRLEIPVAGIPTGDAVYRFLKSNPETSAAWLIEIMKLSTETSRCSNGRLHEIWRQAGGTVKKDRAWIEVDLLPGLLRLLSEIPPREDGTQPIARQRLR